MREPLPVAALVVGGPTERRCGGGRGAGARVHDPEAQGRRRSARRRRGAGRRGTVARRRPTSRSGSTPTGLVAAEARRALAGLRPIAVAYVEEPLRVADPRSARRARARDRRCRSRSTSRSSRSRPRGGLIAAEARVHVVLKAARVGGPTRLLALARRAHAAGLPVIVTDAIESAVGTGVAVHVAAALPSAVAAARPRRRYPPRQLVSGACSSSPPRARCGRRGWCPAAPVARSRRTIGRPAPSRMAESLFRRRASGSRSARGATRTGSRCWPTTSRSRGRRSPIGSRCSRRAWRRWGFAGRPPRRPDGPVAAAHRAHPRRAARSGSTLVLLNTRLAAPEMAVVLAHAEPALVVHDAATRRCSQASTVPTITAEAALDASSPTRSRRAPSSTRRPCRRFSTPRGRPDGRRASC